MQMFQDYKDLLSAFHAHGVKYLIVGGYAVSFHSQPRFTKDLDIFVRADADNARKIYRALAEFGAALGGIAQTDLADPSKFTRFGFEPQAIDIMPGIDGVIFDDAWDRRVEGIIDAATGQIAFFISKQDLIASKLAGGRPRDLADVDEIKAAGDA
jgi:Nucleotidyl transferase of unknown function (DUF2204)